jgi:alkanesulfonate monooxygenase SsuD/methylene tetrahydromethanopterin reductase-like flavin-dependent oxidoreductase (luciferase family)
MKAGLTLPQGCDREYLGLDAAMAWERTVAVARQAEAAGFGTLWLYDHMQVDPPPEEAIVFDPFVEAAALAMATSRARVGHLVLCAAYRNAALTAKMISTLDVVSGGRAVLGIGAGWKEDEWLAYGYGFPDARTRLAILADHLEVITRMLGPGRATYEGRYAQVREAIHEPKSLQPRIPVVVGGNGPKVTWRLAARFADELCLDALPPAAVAEALPVIAGRCREIGRDPASLAVSVHVWGEPAAVTPGPARRARLAEYADLGVDRVILQGFGAVGDPGLVDALAADCDALGLLGPDDDGAGQRDRPRPAIGSSRSTRPSRTP